MGMYCQESCLSRDLNFKVSEFHLLLRKESSSLKYLICHFRLQLCQKVLMMIILGTMVFCFTDIAVLTQIIEIMLV